MSTSSDRRGVGFGDLLTVMFIGLKLAGFIDWSWWVVLSPTWAPMACLLCLPSLKRFSTCKESVF